MIDNLKAISDSIDQICNFCFKNKKNGLGGLDTWEKMFRYVAFCLISGKVAIYWDSGEVKSVMFYWNDNIENINKKYNNNEGQFQWDECKNGDSFFIGECIGDRRHISEISKSLFEKYPHLESIPFYTYRRGTLVGLNNKTIKRFMS